MVLVHHDGALRKTGQHPMNIVIILGSKVSLYGIAEREPSLLAGFVAQNDELLDAVCTDREVEGQSEWGRQTGLIVLAVDVGDQGDVVSSDRRPGDLHRHSVADD